MLAKHIKIAEFDCHILPFDRIAYRAGMREAARIARERGDALRIKQRTSPFKNIYPEWLDVGADDAADAIERAAGGEG